MTIEQLIAEGRRLQRRTLLLEPAGSGDCDAIWYGDSMEHQLQDDHRCWLSVNAGSIPSCSLGGWLSIFTNEQTCVGGRIDVAASPLSESGLRLRARELNVLPPIDAVFARGSEDIGRWLAANSWERDWGGDVGSNFRDRKVVQQYRRMEQRENPLYWPNAYATLGGWHHPWLEDDWNELLEAQLLVCTYKDSEPWVEAWRMLSGELVVMQRIT